MLIPKRITMTGSTEHLGSLAIQSSLAEIQAKNKGWDLYVYSDDEQRKFVRENFGGDIYKAYLSINPVYGAAKADFFRYLAIYKHGGVYLDIKSTCIAPLGSILSPNDRLVLCQWDNKIGQCFEGWGLHSDLWDISGGEFVNWFFAATPGHSAVASAINYVFNAIQKYDLNDSLVGRSGILVTTGPVAWTRGIFCYIRYLRAMKKSEEILLPRIDKRDNLQLIYSILDNAQDPSASTGIHRTLFSNHYTACKEPIIIR